MNYPVVGEHVLGAVQGNWWSRRRRRDDVPSLPPGATYVFRVGGNYRQFPEGMVFDPSHADVLDASSVSLVDTRARMVEVERTVPSVSEADHFTVRASFACQVTDPTVVARQGIIDVTVPLRAYLAGDSELPRVSAGHRVEEVNAVRREVSHRMTAYSAIVTPRVAGMSVEFVSAEVHASDDLRNWEQKLRDERRSQELRRGQRDFETQDTQRIAELLSQGSDYADAFGIARNRIDVAQAAARIHRTTDEDSARRNQAAEEDRAHARARETADAQMRRDMVLTLLRQMGQTEDYVDYHQVLEQVLRDSGGPAVPAVESGPGRPGPDAPRRLNSGTDRPHDGFVKDEDDLLD
ncbi:hypothetical protein [Streptomyces nigrescens]|uniref:Band 7 domain-containing protein n=2 Tax=Streptomyces nigrescens TaxID=1920 RepID=A0A640TIZ0_STRNI|nr:MULTISPECIES: hypothetical protein [Streptomyces]WAT97664.1 hypothetical protein STRLI_003623 [Streptomyces libani subsp. libani]WAU05623.1 hypothetical protein STRNI_004014 [Streptomyces nigrescens]GFE23180.1 hypothetical protein Sliba_36330 [Streptomyces libani subsp. libani]GGV92293.1 hypothetical protein GCM10010500_25030 [Streptomyces libani subsp. libani]